MEPTERSFADLIRDLVSQLSDMVRHEIGLARAEMSQKASQAASGLTSFGIALALGIGAVVMLLFAATAALALVLATWLSALIVGVVAAALAAAIAAKGKADLKARNLVPSRTAESVRDDARFVKERVR